MKECVHIEMWQNALSDLQEIDLCCPEIETNLMIQSVPNHDSARNFAHALGTCLNIPVIITYEPTRIVRY